MVKWILPVGLFFFLICVFLTGTMALPVTDPVESLYYLTGQEMVQSGDWISTRIYNQYWFDKPAFFYWELATGFLIFGFKPFAARFFPILMGLAIVFWTYRAGTRYFNRRTGILAAAILGTTVYLTSISKLMITDTTLVLFICLALDGFFQGINEPEKRLNMLSFYFWSGLAFLTKGPLGIALPGMIGFIYLISTGGFNRQGWRRLRLPLGIGIFMLTALPWYAAAYFKHGQAFIDAFFGVHNVMAFTSSEHPSVNVFYYYLPFLLLGFFPWTLMLPLAFRKVPEKTKTTRRFLAIWVLVVFVVFTVAATKYPTYILPLFPPLTLLVAAGITGLEKVCFPTWARIGLPFLNTVIFVFAAFAFKHYLPQTFNALSIGLAVVVTLYWVGAFLRDSFHSLGLWTVSAGLQMMLVILLVVLPVQDYLSSKGISDEINKIKRPGVTIAQWGSYDASVAIYTHSIPMHIVSSREMDQLKGGGWASVKHKEPVTLDEPFLASGKPVLIVMMASAFPKFTQNFGDKYKIIAERGNKVLVGRR